MSHSISPLGFECVVRARAARRHHSGARVARPASLALLLTAACTGWAGCHGGDAKFPSTEPPVPVSGREHGEVRTLNPTYNRVRSHVLVREIDRPTRATLDYAAYHANFMIADQPPEDPPEPTGPPSLAHPFSGLVEPDTLTPDVTKTPLNPRERNAPLAFAPLSEYLLAHKIEGADMFAELGSSVRSETWGQPATPGIADQSVSEVYLHGVGEHRELWVKIEFAPWFKALGTLPDQDHDGFPEVYGRATPDRLTPGLIRRIVDDYAGKVLTSKEVKAWANQLSSYWYPSFNTDLVPAGPSWPDDHTEPEIEQELAGLKIDAPSLVLRGKPQGKPTYEVFSITGLDLAAVSGGAGVLALEKSRPSPDPDAAAAPIRRELEQHGGTWEAWSGKLASVRSTIERRLKATPKAIKALAGADGFLFFRTALEFIAGGDLESQPAGKNPIPIIVEFKRELERLGVDFLFVPVPSKAEIFPDEFDPRFKAFAGEVVNPFERKFIVSLAEQGVEVFDLHAPFLAARKQGDAAGEEPLYQHQDTHWTSRGLELAAQLLSARVKKYPWYAGLAKHAQRYATRDAIFTRFGDLHSRLPEAQKKKYAPETLTGHQVLRADGTDYEDDPDSPIVLLGDSFTGVYELTDVEHAGLSAHIARNLSYPIDLVMSYGGGPNVRNKLMRRGEDALAHKKLVIWAMADRDLYNYWEDWQPLKAP